MGTKGRMIKTYAHPLQHAIMLALSFVKENHHKPTKMYTLTVSAVGNGGAAAMWHDGANGNYLLYGEENSQARNGKKQQSKGERTYNNLKNQYRDKQLE